MSDTKVTQLATLTSLADADLFIAIDNVAVTPASTSVRMDTIKTYIEQQGAVPPYYAITAAETTAGVTPSDYSYPSLHVFRYASGTINDGVGDAQPAIQTAINVAAVNGGEVYLPRGTYLLTTTYVYGSTFHLYIGADNISIKGAGWGTQLKTVTASAAVFLIHGAIKVAGVANWQSYQMRDSTETTTYTISGTYSAGGMSVTTATAGHAANFSPGDLVLIRSGQNTAAGVNQPDAEINEVLTATAGTGVIELVRPLAKDYAQENFNAGSSGVSSIGGAGSACVYGIANVEDRMLRNLRLSDFSIDSTAARHALIGGQIDGFRIERIKAKITGQGFKSMGAYRDVWLVDNNLHTRGTGSSTWHLSVDSSCVDCWMLNNQLTSERTNYVHILEGAARVHCSKNTILNTPSASNDFAISVSGRAYDIEITDNIIVNAGTNAAIYVGTLCPNGGTIRGNIVKGENFAAAISVGSPGWDVQHAVIGANDDSSEVSTFGGVSLSPGVISGWVYFDDQNPSLGKLPAYTYVSKVTVHVTTAFDSDGTDLLRVGWTADTDGLLNDVDVSTTGVFEFTGAKNTNLDNYSPSNVSADRTFDADTVAVAELADIVGTIINDRKAQTLNTIDGYNHTAWDLEALYTAGGSTPTTGKALVVIEYYRTERRV